MAKAKTKAPELTLEEDKYLRELAADRQMVRVRLNTGEEFEGTVEFHDAGFLRLTRGQQPNLLLYKKDIKYLWEVD